MKDIIFTAIFIFITIGMYSQITNTEVLKAEEGIDLILEDIFSNSSSGSVINNGNITFNNTYNDGGVLNVSPSSSTIINGNYSTSGILEVVINGSDAGNILGYSQININGNLTLTSSTINVIIDPAYLPGDGTKHTVITYTGNLTDTFTTVNLPSTGWYVDYSTPGEVNVVRDLVLAIENVDMVTFLVYPNPTSGIVNIQTKEDIDRIEIYDINGRLIFNKLKTSQVNISQLSVGVYILKVVGENGESSINRIIKN